MTRSPSLWALCLAPVLATAAPAADIPKPPSSGEYSTATRLVNQMRSGTLRVAGPDTSREDAARHRAALKTVADYLAFTICTPPYNGEPVPREDKTPPGLDRSMNRLMTIEAESFAAKEGYLGLTAGAINLGKVSVEQLEYAIEFGKAIAASTQVVLANSVRPIERINAVRLMSIVARIPAPDLAEPLVAVVNNPRASDAEKLYAFQGLRNLLEQSDTQMPDRHIPDLHRNPERLAAIGAALTNYITARRNVRDDKDRQVIEFVRRYAVEAMARFKDGVLRRPNKELIYRPSWTLARVIEQDPSASPPFTIAEQTEAAIGFCAMKIDPDMNLDVAAYSVAKVLVAFARSANLDSERAKRDATLPALPWKPLAARWSYALAQWRGAAGSLPAARNPAAVTSLANAGIAMLAPIEKDGPGANTGAEVQAIMTWATNNPPRAWTQKQSAILYTDDPQSILPFPAAANTTLKTPDPKAAPDPKKTPPADPKKAPPVDPKKGPPKK